MTERTEIERLLNMTGRTLEGLPESYEPEDALRASMRGKERAWTQGEVILHQSDVIELLVGALRDALDKQPKWISVEEQPDPPQDGEYWCYGYWIGSGRKQAETAEYLCGEWKIVNNFVLTHWMLLPEPPKEE